MEKTKENALNQVYQEFIQTCMGVQDMDGLARLVDENIFGFGSALDEKIQGIEGVKKLLQNQIDQSSGIQITWKIEPFSRFISKDENTAVFADDGLMTILTGDEEVVMYLRLSVVLNYIDTKWKVIHWHVSKPEEVESEKDTWGIENWKQKAEELERLVAEKTADLVEKNRELEIEAALERVRAVAMGMKKPEDMLDVCRMITQQLEGFGVTKIRNVQTAIIDETIGQYLCYQYFPAYNQTTIEDTLYHKSPVEHEMVRQMLSSRDGHFIGSLTGEELETFRSHRKEENHFPDPLLDETAEVSYSFLSIGEGGLGLSLYNPMKAAVLTLFQRFHQVFSLAYQRFRDIEKAEKQAREAEIELALERVRARTMAMQNSDELPAAANLLFQQVQSLGMPAWSAGYCTWNQDLSAGAADKSTVTLWMSSEGIIQPPFTAPTTEDWLFSQMRIGSEEGKSLHVVELGGEELEQHYRYMRELPVVGEILDSIIEAGHPLPTFQIMHQAYFSKGFLLFITYEPVPESHEIFIRFAKVFDQTYTRFLDLQKAEAQAREAQIEAALERVRTRTMAMFKSEELSDVAEELFKQVSQLGGMPDRISICVIDEPNQTYQVWATDQVGAQLKVKLVAKLNEKTTIRHLYADWKAGKKSSIIELQGLELKNWIKYLRQELGMPISMDGSKGRRLHNVAYFSHGWLNLSSSEPVAGEVHDLLQRFASVFSLTYTRFLDLQKAEAQAREAQIEAALERVRSRSMAMHQSEELKEVIQLMFEQFRLLNFTIDSAQFDPNYKENDDLNLWAAAPGQPYSILLNIPYDDSPLFNSIKEAKKRGLTFITQQLSFEDKNQFFRHFFQHIKSVPAERQKFIFDSPGMYRAAVFMENVSLAIQNYSNTPYTEEENDVLKRFGKTFEQVYTRFLDLQKAEAQAREAQIEAALERVRSKTMAMHNSQDVGESVATLFDELVKLGVKTNRCGILIYNDPQFAEVWTAKTNANEKATLIIGKLDITMHPMAIGWHASWANKEPFFSYELKGQDMINYYQGINNSKYYPTQFNLEALPAKEIHSDFHFSDGSVFAFTNEALSTESASIFKRFTSVFGQTYRRFLDLQKAEAQAREAQIEAALERVRSRTMAMQHSEDLTEVANLLFQQVQALGVPAWSCGFNIWEQKEKCFTGWMSSQGILQPPFKIPFSDSPTFNRFFESRQKEELFYVEEMGGDTLVAQYEYMRGLPGFGEILDNFLKSGFTLPTFQINHVVNFLQGNLIFITSENVPEAHDLFKRFAKVFEQTYTRFLDLQKAEAQAREAQIEAALEKVRSRSLAMQKPEELVAVAELLRGEMGRLGVEELETSSIYLVDSKNMQAECWYAIKDIRDGDKMLVSDEMTLLLPDTWVGREMSKFFQSKKEETSIAMKGDNRKEWINYCADRSQVLQGYYGNEIPERTYHLVKFNGGYMGAASPGEISPASWDLLKRAAAVFSFAYTRFKDLQDAAARAREAQIELAMEKVRGRTMAMQSSDELADAAYVLFEQLKYLGVTHERINIGIVNEDNQTIDFWITEQGGDKLNTKFSGRISEPTTLSKAYAAWKNGEKSLRVDLQGEELKSWLSYLNNEIKIPFNKSFLHNRRVQTAGFFSKGMLILTSPEPLQQEALYLLEKFAGVFDLTYTRFSDLKLAEAQALQAEKDLVEIKIARQKAEDALAELKSTQAQLIQSEKMASLGELTAGIAHEIQNPLNFVNNFSEVNSELIDEQLEEIEKGDLEGVKELAHLLKENSSKITLHGKRADAIVKGMLEHSKRGSGQKELTDLNALADDFLRMTYQSFLAKDPNFKVEFKTNLDPDLPKISVIPQDIGKVLLNLYSNAFYACGQVGHTERSRSAIVTVSTSYSPLQGGRGVEISVSDNGPGIPDSIKDKIFQPFFTTKPTGQGTGLGLSLSYDIVKAHGGELKVETKEGDGLFAGQAGTVFIIKLPIH